MTEHRQQVDAVTKAVPTWVDPEQPVVEAIRQGDADAMAEFVARNTPWVRGVVFAVTGRSDNIDDVLQQVWVRAWRQAGSIHDPSRWRAWLYSIARHAGQDSQRRLQRRTRLHRRWGQWRQRLGGGEASPEVELIRDEQHRMTLDAIGELPAMYREPFVLRHLEDWSYAQIADVLGISAEGVETRLVRARRMLREKLKGRV